MNKEQKIIFSSLASDSVYKLFESIPTPSYIIDEEVLEKNCSVLKGVIDRTSCKILLAQKAFSNYDFYPLISHYLSGTEASGLYEARLGYEKMPGKEVHVFCAAYKEKEFDELLKYADHIVFNSVNQLKKFGKKAKLAGKSIGIRINPEFSTQKGHEIYDPCAKGSRLGVTKDIFDKEMTDELLSLVDGLHFHTLCEQNSSNLISTFSYFEKNFSSVISKMKWINLGGGHHITRFDYDILALEELIIKIRKKYGIEVYLEPGEAIALNAGYLVSKVLDIVTNGSEKIAIIDASAACHMPDVIEMPYLPPVLGAKAIKRMSNRQNVYKLAGPTCLAGDVIGSYSFNKPLNENDLVIFGDMAIYSTCKNNTFNGMPLPDIWKLTKEKELVKLTSFGYNDFKYRLGKRK